MSGRVKPIEPLFCTVVHFHYGTNGPIITNSLYLVVTLPGAYFGAIVGFFVGILLQGRIFGQTSSAGFHAPSGYLKTKRGAVFDRALFIAATTLAGYLTGGLLLALFLANPLIGFLIVLAILYVGLHQDIDNWNLLG